MKDVYLVPEGKDYHGAGCDCGLCNSNGHSYEVKIVEDASDNVLESVYAASEEAAMATAAVVCRRKGWINIENE